MAPGQLALLAAAVLAVAFLYSSVGQAGASGYIAVMSLFGLAPGVMKPTALTSEPPCRKGTASGISDSSTSTAATGSAALSPVDVNRS